jgi:hypothetical protein
VLDYNIELSTKLHKSCINDGKVLLDVCEMDDAVIKRDVLIGLGMNVKVCESGVIK